MTPDEYVFDPCGASSLPFWKSMSIPVPEYIRILRDDLFREKDAVGYTDELYFKLIHHLNCIPEPVTPPDIVMKSIPISCYAAHINRCYDSECVSTAELEAYKEHPVYDPALWVSYISRDSGEIVATGIAELDSRIGEGILEWIQVTPAYRGKGYGKLVVNELLHRLIGIADFVTVSGQVQNKTNPLALYESCGFSEKVIWHILQKK